MSSVENSHQRLEFKKSKKYYVPRFLLFSVLACYLPYLAFTIAKWTILLAISFIIMMGFSVYSVFEAIKYIFKDKIYLAIDSSGISNEDVLVKWEEIESFATLKVGRLQNLHLKLTLVADNITVIQIPLYYLYIDETQIREYINSFNTNPFLVDKGTSNE